MNTDVNHITDMLDSIDQMQASHIQSFETELMPDLASQMIQRKTQFSELKKSFDRFISRIQQPHAEDTDPVAIEFIERINGILNQNAILEKKTKRYKDSLQKSIKEISKGKKSIGLYGSPSSSKNKPRAIDLTN